MGARQRLTLFLQVAVVQGEAHQTAERRRKPRGRQPAGCPTGVKEPGATESILTHAPIPFAAAAGTVHPAGIDSQPDEVTPPRPRSVASASLRPPGSLSAGSLRCASSPLFPMIEPHPSSHPFIEFQHRGIRVADAEVVHPPEDVAPQFVDDECHVLSAVAFGDLIRCTHPSGSLTAVYLRFASVPLRAV